MFENLLDALMFTVLYTAIIAIVSGYYFFKGQSMGIKMVLITLKEEEPEMSKLFIEKLEKKLEIHTNVE